MRLRCHRGDLLLLNCSCLTWNGWTSVHGEARRASKIHKRVGNIARNRRHANIVFWRSSVEQFDLGPQLFDVSADRRLRAQKVEQAPSVRCVLVSEWLFVVLGVVLPVLVPSLLMLVRVV